METFGAILLIVLTIWFWLDSLRARELATGICRAVCKQRNLQFLDQTVALARLGIRWFDRGPVLRRVYRFDYSEEGVGRHAGHVIMLGIQLEEFSLGLPTEE